MKESVRPEESTPSSSQSGNISSRRAPRPRLPGSELPLNIPPGHHLGGTRCSRMRVTVALEASLVHEVADNAAIVFATSLRSDGTASTRE